jgi:hypothetical protein
MSIKSQGRREGAVGAVYAMIRVYWALWESAFWAHGIWFDLSLNIVQLWYETYRSAPIPPARQEPSKEWNQIAQPIPIELLTRFITVFSRYTRHFFVASSGSQTAIRIPIPPTKENRSNHRPRVSKHKTEEMQKHTTGGIPRWSPTLVLVARFSAYVWQSGRDAQFSLTYGRMYELQLQRVLTTFGSFRYGGRCCVTFSVKWRRGM